MCNFGCFWLRFLGRKAFLFVLQNDHGFPKPKIDKQQGGDDSHQPDKKITQAFEEEMEDIWMMQVVCYMK